MKRLLTSMVLLSAFTTTVVAEGLPSSYAPPEDAVAQWGKFLVIGLIAAAMALTAYTLIGRRGRLAEPHSKWMLFLGVAVLPVPAILLSTAVGMERSKSVAFCSSCHAMDPFIADLQDPESERLAAVHYKNRYIPKNQCYSCHTDYGMFGTLEAKTAGMRHVYKDITGNWSRPIEIHAPYRYRICLNCHAGAVGFEELHQDEIRDVVDGNVICSDCHELAHPSREERAKGSE